MTDFLFENADLNKILNAKTFQCLQLYKPYSYKHWQFVSCLVLSVSCFCRIIHCSNDRQINVTSRGLKYDKMPLDMISCTVLLKLRCCSVLKQVKSADPEFKWNPAPV